MTTAPDPPTPRPDIPVTDPSTSSLPGPSDALAAVSH